MVTFELVYEGGLHTTAVHGPSKARVETDAPVDNMGKGESFSPTDLLATSLGTCMLTTMGILAQREGWKIDGARARVEKHMALEPRRRVGRIVVELSMPRGVPFAARERLREVADRCPVACSIHPETKIELTIGWPD